MIFSLKYLGMTLVEQPKGEEMSAAAVKRIVATVSPSCGSQGWLLSGVLLVPCSLSQLDVSGLSLPLSPLASGSGTLGKGSSWACWGSPGQCPRLQQLWPCPAPAAPPQPRPLPNGW